MPITGDSHLNLRPGLIRLWVLASAIWMMGGDPFALAADVGPPPGLMLYQPQTKLSDLWVGDLVPHQAPPLTVLPQCPVDTSVVWNNCQGVYTAPSGAVYVGDFHEGKFSGQGTAKWPNGQRYVGEWYDNKRNGQGIATLSSGAKYVGEFRDDKSNGHGTLTLPSGTTYVGEFRDGQSNGYGTLTFREGKYIGEFRENKFNGKGTLYLSNGAISHSGIWSNGEFVRPASVASNASSHAPIPSSSGRTEVSLVGDSGTFKVPVLINGVLPLRFTVDSGASDVTIPADVVMTLMRTGTLRPDDFLGTQTYRLADGSTMPSKTFRIRSLKVGDKVIENVTGSMTNVEGSLLLGQSFLSRFKRVSFNYNRQVLELE